MASKIDELSVEYTSELFFVAFQDKNFFDILTKNLDPSFLTHDYEKEFWKECMLYYRSESKTPTLGYLSKKFIKNKSIRELISELKSLDLEGKQIDSILEQFEDFIKESKFVKIFEESGDSYNKGDYKKAFEIYLKGAGEIADFSIRDKLFDSVFGGFQKRNTQRLINDSNEDKVPFGIDKLDECSFGGPQLGDAYLIMAESGIGKSQFLYHHAIHTARMGGDAAIFQIEGTKKQVLDRLDSAWSGVLYHDMKYGNIDDTRFKKLQRVIQKVRGEIFVESYERFGGVTFYEIRKSARELKKHNPNLKLVLIDYLELMEVGDSISYGPNHERSRQQKLGKLCKELAMELNCVVGTVTQASNLPSELKKDPAFVMTREYLSEDKGKLRPFDFMMTLNQTYDERRIEDDISGSVYSSIRIYNDKMREYESGQTIKVINNFSRARFYDRKKTLELIVDFDDEE